MTLEQFFVRRFNEIHDLRWVLTAKDDAIDVFVPNDENLNEVASRLKIFSKLLTGNWGYEPRIMKLSLWNDLGERLLALVDPGLESMKGALDHSIINAIPMGYLCSD